MRYAVSACYRCLSLRADVVRPVGDPDDLFWFGCCAGCDALRWFELVGFLLVDLAPVHKED